MDYFPYVFYFLAALTLFSAGVVVFGRNMVRSAFALLFTFFGVAGLYVLLFADFVAVAQVLIYIGGILVLIIFGIMLTNKIISVDVKVAAMHTLPAMLLAAALGGTLIGVAIFTPWTRVATFETGTGTVEAIGKLLMSSFVLPFEVASVMLLIAIIGAALIARREKKTV